MICYSKLTLDAIDNSAFYRAQEELENTKTETDIAKLTQQLAQLQAEIARIN